MAQPIADLVLLYAGFLCAWPPLVAMIGKRGARRYGAEIGADMRAVAGPTLGLVFLAVPPASALLGVLMEALALPADWHALVGGGAMFLGGTVAICTMARKLVLDRHGAAIRDDLRGPAWLLAPGLMLLCLLIEAQLFVGVALLAAWVALLRHRADVRREGSEEAARLRAARTYELRSRMGGSESPFRR